MSTELTLEARQGDTFGLTVTWTDQSGSAIDLTGASIEFGIAPNPGASPNFQYDTSDYITIESPETNGIFSISVPPSVTRLWTGRRYVYEISVTLSGGNRTTVLDGRLRVTPEVVV